MNEFANIILLTDEDGKEVEFEHIETLEHLGQEYILLSPVEPFEDDAEEDEESVVILRMVSGEDGDTYESIDDEALLEEVFNKFMELLEEDEPFEL